MRGEARADDGEDAAPKAALKTEGEFGDGDCGLVCRMRPMLTLRPLLPSRRLEKKDGRPDVGGGANPDWRSIDIGYHVCRRPQTLSPRLELACEGIDSIMSWTKVHDSNDG